MADSFAARLEPFLLMGKSAKGAAAAKLVQDATGAPGVFVFGELLELPSVQELEASEQHKNVHELLKIFAYGTYEDYVANKAHLPALNAAQTTKLKCLSLVALASRTRLLPYATLQRSLDIPTIRELEHLIIDAIYQDLLSGKLDQRHQRLEVSSVVGRDLPPGELQGVLDALKEWSNRTAAVLSSLDVSIRDLASSETASKLSLEEHEKRRDALLAELVAAKAAQKKPLVGGGNAGGGDYMEVDDERGGGGGGFLGGLGDWGRKKNARGNQNIPEKPQARKRNRF
ncbi:hypothetical protein EXIGLDRAFT_722005 [Exidia glandulosa HHB12029]|uniref:PCI domain-containing protein n=1 Tax=Exidia glandulosa HHB12029 TaxID=1314781 RepID=A0A165FIT1_EXIGL|nr:hypothetical protein EXIGLDRAFT_722005 [Exidia glandulosa HHB12029]